MVHHVVFNRGIIVPQDQKVKMLQKEFEGISWIQGYVNN